MANQKSKKTKEDFTSLILGIEVPAAPAEEVATRVLSETKNEEEKSGKTTKTKTIQLVKDDKTKKEDSVSTKQEHQGAPDSLEQSIFSELANQAGVPTGKTEIKHIHEMKYDPSMVSIEAALKQAELLKLAQNKIQELEECNQRLTHENEALAASASVLQKKNEQLNSKLEDLTQELASVKRDENLEFKELEKTYQALKKEYVKLDTKYQETKALVSEKFQASYRREKELLNRLEILQQEGDVVLTTKDERILSLKKEIDKYQYEMSLLKSQLLDQQNKMKAYKEQVKRSWKALKIASSLLEEDDDNDDLIKKTGT